MQVRLFERYVLLMYKLLIADSNIFLGELTKKSNSRCKVPWEHGLGGPGLHILKEEISIPAWVSSHVIQTETCSVGSSSIV